jgi:hypothetical protein
VWRRVELSDVVAKSERFCQEFPPHLAQKATGLFFPDAAASLISAATGTRPRALVGLKWALRRW